MNPARPRHAAEVLNQQSRLVTAVDSSAAPGGPGFSQSGRPIAATSHAVLRNELIALFGKTASRSNFQFRISVDGGPAQLVDLGKLDFTVAPLLNPATIRTNICTTIAALINARVSTAVVSASLTKGPSGQTGEKNHKTRLLRIASAKGDVRIFPGPDPATDIAAALMLGTAQGGAEISRWAASRHDTLSASVTTSGTDIGGSFNQNTRYYSLGGAGGAFQAGAVAESDGGPPSAADYERAYETADREIDLFNLLVLPKDADLSDATTRALWGPASRFCERRRAFLIMDPPSDWTTAQQAAGPAVGVDTLRNGLVEDHVAVFYPNLRITEAGKDLFVGPSGAIAGLMARVDAARGVWKAPAGTEADLRGVTGVQYRFTDGENGVMNPKGVNTIRVFPNGIVNWGARTMDGDDGFASEYKYIPIRRLALHIEESLYRGVKWVVFEPNDESLWAQIRLNVGAFMNNLFRQGAFQGQSPRDAYFVKCDAGTTTQKDRNLGIVNIVVGFAPLKPAEFVVLTLQQMAGQIEA